MLFAVNWLLLIVNLDKFSGPVTMLIFSKKSVVLFIVTVKYITSPGVKLIEFIKKICIHWNKK